MKIEKIKARYLEMAKGVLSPTGVPYPFRWQTQRNDDERSYIELRQDGTMALVARERGQEIFRREACDLDEFVYLLWCETFRGSHPDDTSFEQTLERACHNMSTVAPNWVDRYRRDRIAERDELAKRHEGTSPSR